VILIDAVVTGKPAGTVTVWDASDAAVAVDRYRCSTHAFGVAEAVQLARVLERLPRRLLIYGIEGRRFDLGSAPSVDVVEASDRVALALAGGARV